jgi:hypothetical protein
MPNSIKYNVSAETLALKKGNFWIGTGDVGKGPTSTSGFYNGITPPSGGYTIYLNKASGGPSIYVASNDAELISRTNQIAGTSYTTANECFNYYASQSDKMVFNRDYEGIVTNGLVLNVDAGFTPSYTSSGTTWYDLSYGGNNGTLTNGPTFNSSDGGSIVFDGVDDNIFFGNPSQLQFNNATFSYGCWFYWANTPLERILMGKRDGNNSINVPGGANFNQWGLTIAETMCCGPSGKKIGAYLSCDGGAVQGGNLIADLPNNVGWINCFITVNTTEQRLYINGILSSTTNQNFTNRTFNIVGRSFYVGCTGGETEGTIIIPFNNKIALAQIYNRTLTANEIDQNFNAQKSRFGL